jgi:hypothetical protein
MWAYVGSQYHTHELSRIGARHLLSKSIWLLLL